MEVTEAADVIVRFDWLRRPFLPPSLPSSLPPCSCLSLCSESVITSEHQNIMIHVAVVLHSAASPSVRPSVRRSTDHDEMNSQDSPRPSQSSRPEIKMEEATINIVSFQVCDAKPPCFIRTVTTKGTERHILGTELHYEIINERRG